MDKQSNFGMFLVDSKGFSYWTAEGKPTVTPSKQDEKPQKQKKQQQQKQQQKPKKEQAPKKEKAPPVEHVKPLAVQKVENVEKYLLKTEKDYFLDTYKFEAKAKLIDILETPKGLSLVFDRTIFHPQGGGQPKDTGHIQTLDGKVKFVVADLVPRDEAILHVGAYEGEQKFEIGQEVTQKIDGEFRSINAKIHSAGHLLDVAMNRAGKTELKPGKGYHFQEGPYVEYIGVLPENERATMIDILNKHCADLISEAKSKNQQVFRKMCSYKEAQEELKAAGGVPGYVAEGQDLRVLKLVPEDLGCPCGGTHVHAVEEIGTIEITKIKKKKQNTQVSYKVIPPAS